MMKLSKELTIELNELFEGMLSSNSMIRTATRTYFREWRLLNDVSIEICDELWKEKLKEEGK